MSAEAEVLNQDEIDALLRGVDNGAVPLAAEPPVPGEVRSYDLATQVRVVRGRMPTLELVNERYARLLRIGLDKLVRRAAQVTAAPVRLVRFGEYTQGLHLPASINLAHLKPLRGTALFVLDASLVSALVECYFGGNGRHAKVEGRDFTRTENRVIQIVLNQAFGDLREAWSPVTALQPEYLHSESNPQFVNVVSPSEVVLVAGFRIEFEGGGGELQVTMPYSMIEPLRELLESGVQGDRPARDANFTQTIREEIEEAQVEVVPLVGHSTVTLSRLLNLKPGDVIPCDFSGAVTLIAEGVPILRGSLGASRGQQAVKIDRRALRVRPQHQNPHTVSRT